MTAIVHDIGHAFASAAHDTAVGAKAVVTWEQRKLNPKASEIEALSGLIPVYGPEIELLERLAFASFGVAAAALHVNSGNVQAATKANPSLTPDLLTEIQSFLQARSLRPAGNQTPRARARKARPGEAGGSQVFAR